MGAIVLLKRARDAAHRTGDLGLDIVVKSVGFIRNALTYYGTSDFFMEVQLMCESRIVL